jgi:hypothetical protein
MESSKTLIVPFNIFMDARYHGMKVVGDEVALRTLTTSLNKSIKKIKHSIC